MEHAPPVRRIPTELGQLQPMPGAHYEVLDPSVRYSWMVGSAVRLIIGGFALILFTLFMGLLPQLIQRPSLLLGVTLVVFLLGLLHLFWPFIAYRYWGYALRPTDLLIRSGVIWQVVIAVPFSRIQHVDSKAGPLTRSLGLADLVIHTAGSHMGTVHLPGLQADHAETLRDYLSRVGHTHANI